MQLVEKCKEGGQRRERTGKKKRRRIGFAD